MIIYILPPKLNHQIITSNNGKSCNFFQLSGTFKGRSLSSIPSVIQIPLVILLVLYLIFFLQKIKINNKINKIKNN